MKRTKTFPFAAPVLAGLLLLLLACAKEKSGPTGGDPGSGETEVSTLIGRIFDDTGAALSGVVVSVPSHSGALDTTDFQGVFAFSSVKVPKGRALVLAQKDGYYDGARAETPSEDGTTRMQLRMMKKTTYAVSASAGGAVAVKGGATLDFPANAFVTSSGSPFTGTVTVAADYVSPDSSTFWDFFSGDNAARTATGEAASLVSAGVLRVELHSSSGAALKLADGKAATLTFPDPASVDAPETMPLWYFDEEIGMWKEEGSATLKDGKYEGTVTHFSDWNLDFKGDNGSIEVELRCVKAPLEGVVLRVGQKTGITDRNGKLRFINAPAIGKPTVIEILAKDNGGLYFKSGSVSVDVQKDKTSEVSVTLDSPCPATLYGKLAGCDDKPAEGIVTVSWDGGFDMDFTKDGDWRIYPPIGKALTVNAQDVHGNKLTPPLPQAPVAADQEQDAGILKICGALKGDFADFKHDSLDSYSNFALSPDGTRLAALDDGKTLVVWDVPGNKFLKRLTAPAAGEGIGEMTFSDDNSRLSLGIDPNPKGYVLDVSKGSTQAELPAVKWLTLSPDGKTVVAITMAKPSLFTLFNADDGTEIKTLNPTDLPPDYPNFTPVRYVRAEDAIIYLTTQADSAIFRVWSIKDDRLLREIKTAHNASRGVFGYYDNLEVEISRDGDRLGVASTDWDAMDIYDVRTGGKIMTYTPTKFGADSTPGTGFSLVLGTDYIFSNEEISKEAVFMQVSIKDDTFIRFLPIPNDGREPRVAFPQASRDGSRVAAENYDSLRVWNVK